MNVPSGPTANRFVELKYGLSSCSESAMKRAFCPGMYARPEGSPLPYCLVSWTCTTEAVIVGINSPSIRNQPPSGRRRRATGLTDSGPFLGMYRRVPPGTVAGMIGPELQDRTLVPRRGVGFRSTADHSLGDAPH